jgi:hypothetical protein
MLCCVPKFGGGWPATNKATEQGSAEWIAAGWPWQWLLPIICMTNTPNIGPHTQCTVVRLFMFMVWDLIYQFIVFFHH